MCASRVATQKTHHQHLISDLRQTAGFDWKVVMRTYMLFGASRRTELFFIVCAHIFSSGVFPLCVLVGKTLLPPPPPSRPSFSTDLELGVSFVLLVDQKTSCLWSSNLALQHSMCSWTTVDWWRVVKSQQRFCLTSNTCV